MRIAQIAPLIERVPPKRYGGTERVVHALTEELVARGHEVTLFASGDSRTSAKLVSVYPHGLRESRVNDIYGANVWTMLNIGVAYRQQEQFDIIHDHSGYLGLPSAELSATPVIMTCHGPFTPENRHIYRVLRKANLVTISKAQASVPGLNYLGTVYNGLPLETYPFSEEHDGYLLFVGRISPEKGAHLAIELALNVDLPLIIAAKLDDVDRNYFRMQIEPYLSEQIRWVGEVDEDERNRLMSRAYAFVHAATWREPFGLTLIEAMACGCPVIGTRMGSIPEIVEDGVTGFVVDSVEEMIDAVYELPAIDRAACRDRALGFFSARRMTDEYERLYEKLVRQQPTGRRAYLQRSRLA